MCSDTDTKPQVRGICLISVPKSGTMFLARGLEMVTGQKVVVGVFPRTAADLKAELAAGWMPEVEAVRDPRSPTADVMARRFALMMARNRTAGAGGEREGIVSDHGFRNYLRFLVRPAIDEVEDPARIIEDVQRGITPDTRRDSDQRILTFVDRKDAIVTAVELARPGDVLLIAGKGHEKYQFVGTDAFPFDDVAVAREGLEARRVKSRAG